jgi:fructuronate reductase
MRYVTGKDERGCEIDVRDPLAPKLRAIAESSKHNPGGLTAGLLEVAEIFGDDLAQNETFRTNVTYLVASLFRRGTIATVQEVNRQEALF